MNTVNVCETFVSLQGESSYAGLPCFFIRLAGCNLHCRYCDTAYARAPGRETPVAELVARVRSDRAPLCEITGGEPLLQPGFPALARAVKDETGKTLLVETNGSCDLSLVPEGAIAVMDVKCPGSGEGESFAMANLGRLRPCDEVKFVLADETDYRWALEFVEKRRLTSLCHAVLFSPVHSALDARVLANWMLRDRVPARLQLQWHRQLGMR